MTLVAQLLETCRSYIEWYFITGSIAMALLTNASAQSLFVFYRCVAIPSSHWKLA